MATSYEIRLCESCGLRYPLVHGQAFGTRCPLCMGDTRLLLSRDLVLEPEQDRPDSPPLQRRKPARSPLQEEKTIRFSPSPDPRGGHSLAVLMDNIRSAWNVGSIFRSADGFGFVHAYLCGITPTPENEAVQKTSLGAEESVTWSHHKDAVKLARGLKSEGWKVFALEEGTASIPISDFPALGAPVALAVGNEVTGVDPGLLDLCDDVFHIPMRGGKKSFNVAMAFSVAAFAMTNRRET